MLPRRCLPSWLGWQLHANGGRVLVGAGLAVALQAPLGKGLAVASQSPPARRLPGVLWISSSRIPPRVAVF